MSNAKIDTSYQAAVKLLAKFMYDCIEARSYKYFLADLKTDIMKEIGKLHAR